MKTLFKKHKSGFTIIELVVVIAIIGILVLLATPRFLGYTQNAQLTRIWHDIKASENYSDEVLINNDNKIPDHWAPVGNDKLNQIAVDKKLYDVKGIVANYERYVENCKATVGYARTQAEADKFNNSSITKIPNTLFFVVK